VRACGQRAPVVDSPAWRGVGGVPPGVVLPARLYASQSACSAPALCSCVLRIPRRAVVMSRALLLPGLSRIRLKFSYITLITIGYTV